MKALFVGPYRQMDGWGDTARNLIYSLLTTKVDLTLRPLYLANNGTFESKLFDDLEKKTQKGFDVVIQNCLPEYFVWKHNCKNIGFFCSETANLQYTPWIAFTNLMDEIWVHSTVEKTNIQNSGCIVPIIAIGGSIDVEKFKKKPERIYNDNFVFYTVGHGERKNLNALVLAFHSEFDRNEPVDLLLKINGNENLIARNLMEFKKTLGLYKNIQQYKTEQLVSAMLSPDDIVKVHVNADCFVMPSYGEAWCLPALDALGFGKTPIVTQGIGTCDFINNTNGWIVDSHETTVLCHERPLPYLYTARETWRQIDILQLRKAMREAYTNKTLKAEKAEVGEQSIDYYSYKQTGERLYAQLSS